MDQTIINLYKAAQVIRLDEKINAWLAENDPKALSQLNDAVFVFEHTHPDVPVTVGLSRPKGRLME